jgi:hypothetical protein
LTKNDKSPERFRHAIALIDAANSADPNPLSIDGRPRPKELVHSEMMTRWVMSLRPDADEALLLAARGHHIRRWESQRSSYPDGRKGYLRWRTDLHEFHSREVGAILEDVGYDAAIVSRVQDIVRKRGLGRDKDVQTLEDALCLVFLETQFADLNQRLSRDVMVNVVRKTWRKMSPDAQALALKLEIDPEDLAFIGQTLKEG